MPSSPNPSPASRFLGVRLTTEEERRLEQFRAAHQLPNRSEAVRQLLAASSEAPAGTTVELPPTRQRELEGLVEDGFFTSVQAAAEYALEVGLAAIVATHTEGFAALRRHARAVRDEKDQRRRADREGRGLLRR